MMVVVFECALILMVIVVGHFVYVHLKMTVAGTADIVVIAYTCHLLQWVCHYLGRDRLSDQTFSFCCFTQ